MQNTSTVPVDVFLLCRVLELAELLHIDGRGVSSVTVPEGDNRRVIPQSSLRGASTLYTRRPGAEDKNLKKSFLFLKPNECLKGILSKRQSSRMIMW